MYNIHQKNNKEASRFLMIITFILNFITIVIIASPNAFAEYQEIYNKTHMLQLKSGDRTIKTEKITTIAELDTDENKFRFTFYTKDFDKQDWTEEEERIPLHIRHTNIAPQYMGVIILHPENVKVLESKQKGFLVRDSMFSKKYGWEKLLPYKDHKNAQIAMGAGEKVIDILLSKIPFANKTYKLLVEYCVKQNKKYYDSIFEEKENYVATMIPLHIPKDLIGYTETARTIEIPFDLSEAKGEQKMSFWINPAFGNPSVNYSAGTWSPGFGRLEGINIDFAFEHFKTSKEATSVRLGVKIKNLFSGAKTWKDPVTGMAFVWVPAGCFQMGCGSWTSDCYNDEKPVHEVCLDGFWIGKYEVTQGQWKKVMGSNPSRFKKGDVYPIEKVSWDDAKEFIRQLNSRTGGNYKFRLPTEAEWEYAARSGGKPEKYAGGSNVGAVAWYINNGGTSSHPVGTKAPNGLDIYDMSGNVYEWCEDIYSKKAYSKHQRDNPIYTGGGSLRVYRGGSWFDWARSVRSALRDNRPPARRLIGVGFRLVRTP